MIPTWNGLRDSVEGLKPAMKVQPRASHSLLEPPTIASMGNSKLKLCPRVREVADLLFSKLVGMKIKGGLIGEAGMRLYDGTLGHIDKVCGRYT